MAKQWYGSVLNRLMENSIAPTIEVGMGVTELMWSDRHPYEVIEVKDQKNVVIRALDHKRIIEEDGIYISESQDYEYFSNPNGYKLDVTFRNGCWYVVEEFSKEMWLSQIDDRDLETFKTKEVAYNYYRAMAGLTAKQYERIDAGKVVKKYRKISLCFGIAEYYYDYSF